MAWIESHQTLAEHPKTKKAARLLKTSVPAVIGHLHLLWWWAMDYAQDGDLSPFMAEEIADAAQWKKDPAAFVAALSECGLVGRSGFLDTGDGALRIHDWWEYAGKMIRKRQADAARKRDSREPSDLRPADIQRMSDGRPADIQRMSQVENSTEQTVPRGQYPDAAIPVGVRERAETILSALPVHLRENCRAEAELLASDVADSTAIARAQANIRRLPRPQNIPFPAVLRDELAELGVTGARVVKPKPKDLNGKLTVAEQIAAFEANP